MVENTTRTYMKRRRETPWERTRKTMRRRMRKFLQKNLMTIMLVGPLLVGMFAGVFIGVKAATYAQSTKINDYGRHMSYVSYTVESGDTIWGIAQDLAALNPEYNDIRQYVAVIKKVNNIFDGEIKTGDTILIPYYISPGGMGYDEIFIKYGIGQ